MTYNRKPRNPSLNKLEETADRDRECIPSHSQNCGLTKILIYDMSRNVIWE
jgi:hypothetical protein